MAAVELPDSPGPRSVSWQSLDFGGRLQGPLGGAAQRVNRLGNRWRVEVEMPVLTARQAREWSAALMQALRLGVVWKIIQPDTPTGSPGSPLVDGASQSGTSLVIDGLTPSYAYRVGQFISIIISGQRYVYQLSESGKAATDGSATLSVEPPLRVPPNDGDTVEIAQPYLQGLIEAPSWMLDVDRLGKGFSFAIEEQR